MSSTGPETKPAHPRPKGRNVVIPEWARLHLWEMQPVRDLLVIAALVLLIRLGYMLQIVTVPLLLALLLAYLFEPLVRRMTRRGAFGRPGAAMTIIAGVIAIVAIPVAVGVPYGVVQAAGFAQSIVVGAKDVMLFVGKYEESPTARGDASESAAPDEEPVEVQPPIRTWDGDLADQPEEVREAYARLPNASWRTIARTLSEKIDAGSEEFRFIRDKIVANSEQIIQTTLGTGRDAAAAILRTVTSIGVLLFTLFLTAFFFYFFSTGYDHVTTFGTKLIRAKSRERTLELLHKMDRVIAGFVRGRLTICVIQCFVFSVGYFLIGVPAAVFLGIGIGILSIVPYAALIGIPISIAMIWLDPPGGFRGEVWWIFGAPVGVYFLGQALDDYVLTPLIQGKATGMDTPLVLFSTIAGGALGGVYGLLLAIPVAACIKILATDVLWPKVQAWVQGRAADPLPISGDRQSG